MVALSGRRCLDCGKPMGLLSLVSSRPRCKNCELKEETRLSAERERTRRERAEQVRQYEAALKSLWEETTKGAIVSSLPQAPTSLSSKNVREIVDTAFHDFLLELLRDDILTKEEEARLARIMQVLNINQAKLPSEFPDAFRKVAFGRLNDGRMPNPLPNPRILLKDRGIAHGEMSASLMKEQTLREWQSGTTDVSFRIMRGVRVHTSGTRGRNVVIGTQVVPDDAGVLTITSQRLVFAGQRRSLEMPHSKLVSVDLYIDGIRFHCSNRKNSPLFQVDDGELLGALVNAAAQQASNASPTTVRRTGLKMKCGKCAAANPTHARFLRRVRRTDEPGVAIDKRWSVGLLASARLTRRTTLSQSLLAVSPAPSPPQPHLLKPQRHRLALHHPWRCRDFPQLAAACAE